MAAPTRYIEPTDATAFLATYGTQAQRDAWAALAGPGQTEALNRAALALDLTYEHRFGGERTSTDRAVQTLSQPRIGQYLFGEIVDKDTVPEIVKHASVWIALEDNNDADLIGSETETTNVVETEDELTGTGREKRVYAGPRRIKSESKLWRKATATLSPLLVGRAGTVIRG